MPPTMLINALEGVRRRVRVLSVAFGVGIVLAAAVAFVLATVFLDYLLNLPAAPRLLLIVATIGGIIFVLWDRIIRPMMARLSLSDIAGRLEHAFPQFDDRLRSTVDFVHQEIPGSDMMKQRVVTEASQIAQQVDLRRAVVSQPVWASMGAGIGAIVLAILLAWAVPQQYLQIAITRLLTPFADAAWPKRVEISVVGDMPQRVPVGHRVDVRMKLLKGDHARMEALIFYRYGDGPEQQAFMTRGEDGTYAASLDARGEGDTGSGTLQVWMKAGDDMKTLAPITVVPRLAVQSVTANIQPPPYVQSSQQNARVFDLKQAPAVLAAGSQVSLSIKFNKPLGGAVRLEPSSEQTPLPQMEVVPQSTDGVVMNWRADQSLRFHVRAIDTDGFRNSGLEEYEFIVRPDQNPTVQIDNPKRNEDRTPVAVIPLEVTAEDDHGINSLKLVIDRLDDKAHWEIDLITDTGPVDGVSWKPIEGMAERQRFRLTYSWDLGALKDAQLKPGDVLEYFVLAQDNFYLDGNTHPPVPSGKLRINIISQEQLVEALTQELRNLAHQVNEVRNNQNRTKEETANLQRDTQGKPQFDASDRAVAERLTNQQSTTASQTKQVVGKLDAMKQRMDENKSPNEELKNTVGEVKDKLDAAAEGPMKNAANEINQAREQAADPKASQQEQKQAADGRNQKMADAQKNQQQASDQLQQALDRLGNLGSLQQSIEKVRALLEKQREMTKKTSDVGREMIGKKPEDLTPEQKKQLEDVSNEQKKLADETDKALQEMQEMSKQLEKSDPTASEAMNKAANTGRQQQVSPNQSRASQNSKQNQQSAAQGAQKQAELGLEMMLTDLRAGERRKLEELQKKLAELQEQLAGLIRRQAGHNLDNLSIQGDEVVAKLTAEVYDDLLAKAERVKGSLPPVPTQPQLSNGQEQTERNTRDIAKTAEELPNGAEPAAHLSRAAERMERAIVFLRDRKLPEAYEPPQVEALASLVEAKRKVDEQQAEVSNRLEQQQKEAIRQVYVRLREEQVKLNDETKRIEGARQGVERALSRPDGIRAGKLPGEQGAISDQTQKLEADLQALGSVVYVWANKDLVGVMNRVKDRLGQIETGKVTQDQQARVVKQLDAMIEALAIKPLEPKFNQAGGGGGGGGGGGASRLPTEAELRLLKGLQGHLNDSTKTADADDPKDKDVVNEIGQRQGQMRDLLDQLLQKASQGQVKLRPEPDNRDMLPEEAGVEAIEDQELDQDLLAGDPTAEEIEKNTNLIGDRMARAKQRITINDDTGKITQAIQERIIIDFEDLIEQARQQQQSSSAQARAQQRQAQRRPPQPNPGQPNNQQANSGVQQTQGNQAAQDSQNRPGGSHDAATSSNLEETLREWGALTPRQQRAIMENAGEQPVEKYRQMIDDYYRSLAIKGREQ